MVKYYYQQGKPVGLEWASGKKPTTGTEANFLILAGFGIAVVIATITYFKMKQEDIMTEDIPSGKKVRGVVAELNTYSKDGKRIGSKLVFRPFCSYYVPKWNDEWGETEFTDPEAFVEEFGEDIAKKVSDGEIISVEHALPEFSIKKECQVSKDFVKHKSKIIYPTEGMAERLIRKELLNKIRGK